MVKIISFEGCIGAGKTTLTNHFSYELKMGKILEEYEQNPFLKEFYEGSDVALEATTTFLLIHYSQVRKAIKNYNEAFILADFSIEKDLVYAKLNLNKKELKVFESVYDYVIQQIVPPPVVIYLDLSLEKLRERILQRGRTYEIKTDARYFKEYNDRVKEYFINETKSKLHSFNVDDLVFDTGNEKLKQIRNKVLEVINSEV